MNQRLAKTVGVAALSIATMGLFIPQAAAHRADNLPAGLDCERLHCTNNTNTDYIVDYKIFCGDIRTGKVADVFDTNDLVTAHQNKTLYPGCHRGEPLHTDFQDARESHIPDHWPSGSAG
ncbi:hypothetical protein [Nocardia macrotermitis]|uniref:hypothetical protein n=1 Tax=Nocardia macrotermitis TaxID=2585198 RepID=UPI0012975E30|nr:hypothetical protein [Nocardia macrotermitis]